MWNSSPWNTVVWSLPGGGGPPTPPVGSFKPAQCSDAINALIWEMTWAYGIPRWFLYALVERESSFDPDAFNASNNGYGLTQLTGVYWDGVQYPMNLASPDSSHQQWNDDMGRGIYGPWVYMEDISAITSSANKFDAEQNLRRFCTAYGVPAVALMRGRYGLSDNNTLRAMAYHWNKGIFGTYDPNNTDYLSLYDSSVNSFRGPVESEDGVWDGMVHYESAAPPPPPPPPPGSLSVTSSAFNVIAAPVPGEDPIPAVSSPANTASVVEVRILNRARKRLADVTDYESVEWVRNLWGENKFTLVVPNLIEGERNEAARFLREHNFIYILFRADINDPTSTFQPEFLGIIEYIRRHLDEKGNDVTEVRGESILRRRVVVPVDAGNKNDEVIGTTETILRSRVNRAFGTSASVGRRSDLIFLGPDQGRGGTIHWTARYDNLLDKMGEYARSANLGFELAPGVSGVHPSQNVYGYELKFISGVDRSTNQTTRTSVIFSSEMKDIRSQEIEISSLGRPNMAYMGGDGEGEFRLIVPVHNNIHINPDVVLDPTDYTAILLNGAQEVVIPTTTGSMKGFVTGTVEGWVNPTSHTTFSSLYYESVAGGTNSRFNLFIDSTGHLVLWIRPNDGAQSVFTSTFTLNTGVWAWVAAEFNFVNDYIALRFWDVTGRIDNDVFSFPGFSAMVNTTPQEILIGNSFLGRMARWRLWVSAMSQAALDEVSVLAFAPYDIGGLVHDWRMDDGEGIWITDYIPPAPLFGAANGYIFPDVTWVSGPDVAIGAMANTIRKEVFWDESSVEDGQDLIPLAVAKFRELGSKITVQIDVLATGPYRYKFHYDLGDIVTWQSPEWSAEAHLKIIELELRAAPNETPSIKMSMGGPSMQYPVIVNRELKQVSSVLRR